MLVRPASEADGEAVLRLVGAALREVFPAETVSETFLERVGEGRVHLAIPDDPFVQKPVGVLASHPGWSGGHRVCLIDTIWVEPGFRRRGAGTALVRSVLEAERLSDGADGIARVVLDVPADNSSLKSLCLSLGMSRQHAPCRYALRSRRARQG